MTWSVHSRSRMTPERSPRTIRAQTRAFRKKRHHACLVPTAPDSGTPRGTAALGPLVPITADHDTSGFACRHDTLSQWLRGRALANASSGATRTYVVCTEERRVVGYFALAAGSIAIESATAGMRRNLPGPRPLIVLGRLAADRPTRSEACRAPATLSCDAPGGSRWSTCRSRPAPVHGLAAKPAVGGRSVVRRDLGRGSPQSASRLPPAASATPTTMP